MKPFDDKVIGKQNNLTHHCSFCLDYADDDAWQAADSYASELHIRLVRNLLSPDWFSMADYTYKDPAKEEKKPEPWQEVLTSLKNIAALVEKMQQK